MKSVIYAVIALALCYAVGYFISLEPNPVKWSEYGRFAFSIAAIGFWSGLKASHNRQKSVDDFKKRQRENQEWFDKPMR